MLMPSTLRSVQHLAADKFVWRTDERVRRYVIVPFLTIQTVQTPVSFILFLEISSTPVSTMSLPSSSRHSGEQIRATPLPYRLLGKSLKNRGGRARGRILIVHSETGLSGIGQEGFPTRR